MNTAVILAAGLGSRLKNFIGENPKGSIKLGSQTIIERSIDILKRIGISKIIIGTGYASSYYEGFEDNQSIFCIKNSLFKTTGSFFTLYNLYNQ